MLPVSVIQEPDYLVVISNLSQVVVLFCFCDAYIPTERIGMLFSVWSCWQIIIQQSAIFGSSIVTAEFTMVIQLDLTSILCGDELMVTPIPRTSIKIRVRISNSSLFLSLHFEAKTSKFHRFLLKITSSFPGNTDAIKHKVTTDVTIDWNLSTSCFVASFELQEHISNTNSVIVSTLFAIKSV